jgi:hypothetical protein
MIFDKVYLLFRIRIRIHNLKLRIRIRIRILQKVSDPYGSGSTTLPAPVTFTNNLLGNRTGISMNVEPHTNIPVLQRHDDTGTK